MRYFGQYLTESGRGTITEYKYRGSDDSILLNYVTNPIYNKLVNYLPRWLAPNTITLTGFSAMGIIHGIQWYYCPLLEGFAPRWVYVLIGICIIFYQTMDALDGKQARRTGSSSPLGMLCDHSCDALVTTMLMLMNATTLQLGPTWPAALFWFITAIGFFTTTWESYYTGELHLPWWNGPNEGLAVSAGFQIASAFMTPVGSVWLIPFPWYEGMTVGHFVMGLTMLGMCLEIIRNLTAVIHTVHKNKKDASGGSPMLGMASWKIAIARATPLAVLLLLAWFWIMFSPTNIMGRHPRLVLWTLGLLLSKLLGGLMIAHMCDEAYRPWSKTIAVTVILGFHAAWCIFSQFHHPDPEQAAAQEDFLLFEFLTISLGSYLHFAFSVAWDLKETLGIYFFTITRRPTKQKP